MLCVGRCYVVDVQHDEIFKPWPFKGSQKGHIQALKVNQSPHCKKKKKRSKVTLFTLGNNKL